MVLQTLDHSDFIYSNPHFYWPENFIFLDSSWTPTFLGNH